LKNRTDGLLKTIPFTKKFRYEARQIHDRDLNIELYKNGTIPPKGHWVVYRSSLRIHMAFLVILDDFLYDNFGFVDNLAFFKILFACFFCLILSFFGLWIFKEFGLVTLIVYILGILLNKQLIFYSINLN